MNTLRIVLADDHVMMREGLKSLVNAQADMEVVGEAGDGNDALAKVHELRPDVVVMDVSMPRLDGIEATRRIRAEWPTIQVVGLSTDDRPEGRHAIEEAGAVAYFSKNDGAAALIAQLLDLHAHLDAGTSSGV